MTASRLTSPPFGAGALRLVRLVALGAVLAVAGCAAGDSATTVSVPPLSERTTIPQLPPPEIDSAMVTVGADLYQRFCAACHGSDLAGDPNWMVPNEDGSYPPPPQDSSGHTWHHGDDLLLEIILEGSEFEESRMPAFGDQLSEADALAILEFFKASWGPRERQFQWEATLRERSEDGGSG